MSTEKIIPSVAVDHCGSLAVDGYVHSLIALYTRSCLGVKFHDAYESEIGSVCAPETSCLRVHEESCIDCVAVFIHLRSSYFNCLSICEIRGIRVQSLVPHGEDAAGVSAAKSAACGAVCYKITVTYLHGVRSGSAARTHCAAVPVPSVLRDEAAATGSESIVLAVTLHDGRRVMNPWLTFLCES